MQPALNTTAMNFRGSALGLFFRYLLVIICSLLIIPYPWFAVLFIAWFVKETDFGGRSAEFFGECRETWWMFVLMALFAMYPNYLGWATNMDELAPGKFGMINLVVSVVNMVIGFFIWVWIVSRIRLEDGETLEFTGGLWGFIWRNIVIVLLFITVIGWAWGTVMLFRWMARSTRGPRTAFTFDGTGWGLLWRTFFPFLILGLSIGLLGAGAAAQDTPEPNTVLVVIGGALCVGCVLAMPWYFAWIVRWLFSSTTVHHARNAQADQPAGEPQTAPQTEEVPPAATETRAATESQAPEADFGFEESK